MLSNSAVDTSADPTQGELRASVCSRRGRFLRSTQRSTPRSPELRPPRDRRAVTLYRASTYKPYGDELEQVINPLTPSEPKGFIGERTDPETGLTYLHARYYDQMLGRFLSPDW
jgi:RHS repeat-associated protein